MMDAQEVPGRPTGSRDPGPAHPTSPDGFLGVGALGVGFMLGSGGETGSVGGDRKLPLTLKHFSKLICSDLNIHLCK